MTILSNLKHLFFIIALVIGGIFLYTVYKTVLGYAESKAIIEQQIGLIKHQEDQIIKLHDQINIQNKFVELRDQEIEEKNMLLDELIKNLGEDADDLAPSSIREYFRRSR